MYFSLLLDYSNTKKIFEIFVLNFLNSNGLFCRFPYPIVQKAVHNGRKCLLCVFNEDGETTHEEFKMVSSKAAIAMYRIITEMHSFFRCDTINSEVFSQVSQDLKGVLASIFLKENNSVGKFFFISKLLMACQKLIKVPFIQ